MKEQTVIIATDHAGLELKNKIINHLKTNSFKTLDIGCFNEESVDYPDYAKKLCISMQDNNLKFGILICGSGIGMSICANRFPHVRAALYFNKEMAKLARQHNDANILVLGAKIIDTNTAIKCVDHFLYTNFLGERHQRRIDKI